MKFLSLVAILFSTIITQARGVAHCTIYNEEQVPFTVFLNGEQKNEEPSANVRIVNLTQPYYKLKIVFKDSSIPNIERKIFQLTDSEGNPVDAVHLMKKNNKGEWVLRWKSQSVFPPYIETDKPTIIVMGNTPVQQTTTTTQTSQPAGTQVNIGIPGGNVSFNTGGAAGGTTTRETTTTITTPVASTTAPCTGNILSQNEFNDALKSIAARSTEDGRLLSARQVLSASCLNVTMVKSVMKLFTTDDKKLDIAKYAYANTVDKGSYYKLNDEFANESSIDELNKAIVK